MSSIRDIRDKISSTQWGGEYLREMDLIIATNALESLISGATLYNSMLNSHIADNCHHLDKELELFKYDLVKIEPDIDNPWKAVPAATEFLKSKPRGHWAVFEFEGRYDAYMSDGYGSVETESGQKFTKTSPNAPALREIELYSHVISYMTYLRRNQILNSILEHSFNESGIGPGYKAKDVRINGNNYNNVEVLEIKGGYYSGGTDAVLVRATRRGVKPSGLIIPASSMVSKFSLEPVMPPEFQDVDNDRRLVSEFAEAKLTSPRM